MSPGAKGGALEVSISIVIVSYNTRDLLLDCLASIYESKGVPAPEVFVVDNASSDGSADAARTAFPACTVIENPENGGFSQANNLAIARASGSYLLLLNPDTRLEPDVLGRMVEYLQQNPRVGMVSCRLVTGDGSLDLACRRSFPSLWDGFCRASGLSALFPGSRLFARYNLTYLDEFETNEVDAVNGAFMFARREAVEEVGPLDDDYFMYVEDMDWCYRFREKGWGIVYHPVATTLHLKGASGNVRSEAMIRHLFLSTEIYYRKHVFPGAGPLHRWALLRGIGLWKWTVIARNALRRRKRTRP